MMKGVRDFDYDTDAINPPTVFSVTIEMKSRFGR